MIYLKYRGFIAFENLDNYRQYLESDDSGTNIIVFASGNSIEKVVEVTHDLNLTKNKVQKVLLFASEENKHLCESYLNERKEEIDGLVAAVETNFKQVLVKYNKAVIDLE